MDHGHEAQALDETCTTFALRLQDHQVGRSVVRCIIPFRVVRPALKDLLLSLILYLEGQTVLQKEKIK